FYPVTTDGVFVTDVYTVTIASPVIVNDLIIIQVNLDMPYQIFTGGAIILRPCYQLDISGIAICIVCANAFFVTSFYNNRSIGVVDLDHLLVGVLHIVAISIKCAPVYHFPGAYDFKAGIGVRDKAEYFIFVAHGNKRTFVVLHNGNIIGWLQLVRLQASRHATGIAYKIQGPDDAVCDKGGRVIYFNHLPARVRTTTVVSGDKHTLHSANPAL